MPRILLVEDDIDVRTVMEHVLLDGGYEVDTSPTADGGCELLDRGDYDLVVADGRLRDGTGMMVADRARAKDISVLIVTGYGFILDEIRASSPRYEVLLKPIGPAELLEAVQRKLAAA